MNIERRLQRIKEKMNKKALDIYNMNDDELTNLLFLN